MSSPSTSSNVSSVALSNNLNIDALIYGVKWGGVLGTGANLTYSFPWTSSESATFSGPNGTGSYSEINEPGAASHGGLTAEQQTTM
jgi:serralysin